MSVADCAGCIHWDRHAHQTDDIDRGDCRRFPPVLVMLESVPVSIFPMTEEFNRCGEWKAKEPGKP